MIGFRAACSKRARQPHTCGAVQRAQAAIARLFADQCGHGCHCLPACTQEREGRVVIFKDNDFENMLDGRGARGFKLDARTRGEMLRTLKKDVELLRRGPGGRTADIFPPLSHLCPPPPPTHNLAFEYLESKASASASRCRSSVLRSDWLHSARARRQRNQGMEAGLRTAPQRRLLGQSRLLRGACYATQVH